MRISWQTGALTEHWMRRRVQDYRRYANLDRLEQRIRELNAQQKMDAGIAAILNAEGIRSAQGRLFADPNIHLLRKRWQNPTEKINGTYQPNPRRWPDNSYSVRGAAEALELSSVTIFKWLHQGRFRAEQLAHGMPWQIRLSAARLRPSRLAFGISAVPEKRHYEINGDPTLADSILDRLIHNSYRLELNGESMRKKRNRKPQDDL
jgi:IstB-like ATP binding protein